MPKEVKISDLAEIGAGKPTEVLAEEISAIAAGMRQLRNGRLNDRALILLIQDAAPAAAGRTKISQQTIRAVLDGIDGLERAFVRKRG